MEQEDKTPKSPDRGPKRTYRSPEEYKFVTEKVLQMLEEGQAYKFPNRHGGRDTVQVRALLVSYVHTVALGSKEVGRENFLKTIEDVNSGKYAEENLHSHFHHEIIEVLVTLGETELLRAYIDSPLLGMTPAEKLSYMKKAIRLGKDETIRVLLECGADWASLDKSAVLFSVLKGVQSAGRTGSGPRMACCQAVFSAVFAPDDLPLLQRAVQTACRTATFSPGSIHAALRCMRENVSALQFLRRQRLFRFEELNLAFLLTTCVVNYNDVHSLSNMKSSDRRIYGSYSLDEGQGDDYVAELLTIIDLAVSGGEEVEFGGFITPELQNCVDRALQTRLVCQSFEADPLEFTNRYFKTRLTKGISGDIAALFFSFLGGI